MIENAGAFAGRIWTALNETEGLTLKAIKTKTKLKEKELYLGLGWLLREDKINVTEADKVITVELK